MGDISAEPSMEEILSSIKRIIAEEGEALPPRPRRGQRSGAALPASSEPIDEDEVLELSDPMPRNDPELDTPIAMTKPQPTPEPPSDQRAETRSPARGESRSDPRTQPVQPGDAARRNVESILSQEAAAASRGSLETLSKLLVKPEPASDGTLEGLVRDMLRPMLREWLDANLPDLVETLVAREIERITAQQR